MGATPLIVAHLCSPREGIMGATPFLLPTCVLTERVSWEPPHSCCPLMFEYHEIKGKQKGKYVDIVTKATFEKNIKHYS